MESTQTNGLLTKWSTSLTDYVCPGSSGTPPSNPDKNVYYPMGWICPKCGNVYGPHVSTCWNCSKHTLNIVYAIQQ